MVATVSASKPGSRTRMGIAADDGMEHLPSSIKAWIKCDDKHNRMVSVSVARLMKIVFS